MSRARAALSLLLALCVVAAACGGQAQSTGRADVGLADGGDASACGNTTCPGGCCDTTGRCQAGNASSACGGSGQMCQDCASMGYSTCDATKRACATPLEACGPSTCGGCCDQNTCYPGVDTAECGSAGQACASCASGAEACILQQCVMPCGPTNCDGCCSANVCTAGTASTACGRDGASCVDCTQGRESCVAFDGGAGGACTLPVTCDANTCPLGCCDALGVCHAGTIDTACGRTGSICQTCSSSETCTMEQECANRPCDTTTCPTGCCDFSGVCQVGRSNDACGTNGSFCQICGTLYACSVGVCESLPPEAGTCGPANCPNGCCDDSGRCQAGASNSQCGIDGASCEDCAMQGLQCASQTCNVTVSGVCNEQSCPSGCCDSSGLCQPGVSSSDCGSQGARCQFCLSAGLVCTNQQCTAVDGGAACSSVSCNGCCDAKGICEIPSDVTCGYNGQACVDCTTLGDYCSTQTASCTSPSTNMAPCSQNCNGCCDSTGACQPGFADVRCGSGGTTCVDCTALTPSSTCDVNGIPVVACKSQEAPQCPALYPACSTALTVVPVPPMQVCSSTDLAAAAHACAGGANTDSCNAFLNDEGFQNSACQTCLEAFDYDFVEQTGVALCLAPYLSATCNHASACMADCVESSCYSCSDNASTEQCDGQVQAGACAQYFAAGTCVTQALASGSGALCNPAKYQSNFGAWLQAVGQAYCGM